MKQKSIKRFSLFVFLLVSTFILINLSFAQNSEQEDLPGWVDRFEYSFEVETDKKPNFYFQTVQPLYQEESESDTIFIQPRVSLREGRATYNLGVGYRKLYSENLILGANIFSDYQALHQHARMGVGFEAIGQVLEARLNSYIGGITNKRLVSESGAADNYEQVADGLDFEIGSPIPYMPWLKLYGSGFWYDFKNFDDKFGWKTRLEAKINEKFRVEFYTWDDNKGDIEYGGRVRFNFAFYNLFDLKNAFKFSEEPFPTKDLREEMLIPVERNFEITVEKWGDTKGLTVEAGRS